MTKVNDKINNNKLINAVNKGKLDTLVLLTYKYPKEYNTIEFISKLINEEVSETGEIEEKVDFDSPFMIALLESLKKKGITYEEYQKSFQEDD